jgi:ABC-type glycerol-3-phosphate transport system permease component
MEPYQLNNHKRTLGILYIVSGTLTILGALAINILISFILSFAFSEVNEDERRALELVQTILAFLPAFMILFFALPTLMAAFGLLTKKSWGVTFALIVGCIKLFSFPIGTALGIYAIWIYAEDVRVNKQPTNG